LAPGREPDVSERLLLRAALLIIGCLAVCSFLALVLLGAGAGDPYPGGSADFFFYPFVRHEPVHFGILIVASAAFGAVLIRGWRISRLDLVPWRLAPGLPSVVLLSGTALVIAGLGARIVLHDYVFTMDEFAADFQARIFAAGEIRAAIPSQWLPFAEALTPTFIGIGPQGNTWSSTYLPVAAAIRALFVIAGVPGLTNPALAALTIPVVWLVARRLRPDEPMTAWVSTVLLAASPQFLFTSMSGYSMPAHLLLNCTWLLLYLLKTRASFAAAGLVGVLAVGLHQPHVHILFVTPFLVRLVLTRRWGAAAYFGGIYVLAAALWAAWWFRLNPSVGGSSTTIFSVPGAAQLLVQPMNLGLLLSWQPIAMSVLAIVGILRWRAMAPIVRDLALSVFLTLGFYFFIGFDQGQGWGYRYAYPVLGNLTLLAGQGWSVLSEDWKRTTGGALVGASLLIAVTVQLPLRAMQVEAFVHPFVNATAFVRSLPADVALIDRDVAWYAKDLVRNDPWLSNGPRVMFLHRLTAAQLQALERTAEVHRVEADELKRAGMFTGD
jgi:hypothetical protein